MSDAIIHVKWDDHGSIHRFHLTEWKYEKLLEQIRAIKPQFNGKLCYIDDDGDCIFFESNVEMEEMLMVFKSLKDKMVRIKTIESSKCGEESKTEKSNAHEKETHQNILCDLCDENIAGIRYKCVVCDDYDLCENCEKTGIHPEHPMLRLANPRTPKGPFESRRRCMRGNRFGRQRFPFTPEVFEAAARRGQQQAQDTTNQPQEQREMKGVEFLKDVGMTLQQVLSNFGIDCDLSVEHGNTREKIPKPETPKDESLSKTPEMDTTPMPSKASMHAIPPNQDNPTQKVAQEVADRTIHEAIQAATTDVLQKATEAIDMASNTVNSIADNPQTREEMDRIMQNAAQATQFAITQAAEMVKRNSSYMAEHTENPQFRTFMANVSQWADQLAQFYPGINPPTTPQPTAPADPTTDVQMEPIDAMNLSTATAIEPDEGPLIQLEPKNGAETEQKEDSEDSDVEVISTSASASPPPPSTNPAPEIPSAAPSTFVVNPFMSADDGWMLLNNSSYQEMCSFYEAKRRSEEAKRKEIEEQIDQHRKQHARLLEDKLKEEQDKLAQKLLEQQQQVNPSGNGLYPQLQEDDCSAGIPYPTLPATVRPHTRICFFKHPDSHVQNAVEQLEMMGYDNCNGWLTRIAEKCQGNIEIILDEAAKDPLHLARLD